VKHFARRPPLWMSHAFHVHRDRSGRLPKPPLTTSMLASTRDPKFWLGSCHSPESNTAIVTPAPVIPLRCSEFRAYQPRIVVS